MTDKVQKIREEVERLKRWNNNVRDSTRHMTLQEEDFNRGKHSSYLEILNFIDSLQEESVSEDLEEACDSYYNETWDEHGGRAMVVDGCHDIWFPSHATDDFFKAGAKWQKAKDQSTIELAEDHAMLAGMEMKKEEMINAAIEWIRRNANINNFRWVSVFREAMNNV